MLGRGQPIPAQRKKEHVASYLDEVGFLGAGDGGFGEEDGVPEAGVGAVD